MGFCFLSTTLLTCFNTKVSLTTSFQVNTQTTVQLHFHEEDLAIIGHLSVEQVMAAGDIAASGLRGLPLRRRLEESDPRVRTLFKVMMSHDLILLCCKCKGKMRKARG